MRQREMMCAAFILMSGLFIANAQAQTPVPKMRTEVSGGSIHGDLTAAGLPGVQEASVAWRDYDDDGDLDFLVMARRGPDYISRVYCNEGGTLFSLAAECVTVDGVTTCEGDQSAGVLISSTSPIELWVQNLTVDITPADSVSGIDVRTTGSNGTGSGGAGGDGPPIEVHFLGSGHAIVVAPADGTPGISVVSQAGNGSGGRSGTGFPTFRAPHAGGAGGRGGDVSVESEGTITTTGSESAGIQAVSRGGNGGNGGYSGPVTALRNGRTGGKGGDGGTVTVSGNLDITTDGMGAHGIVALSQGGKGGHGGSAAELTGGPGGVGGNGDTVAILGDGTIETKGDLSHGIYARSEGGVGGNGGGGGSWGEGNYGASGGRGGDVQVEGDWAITTHGNGSNGITAQSLGANGGKGGHDGWFGGPGHGGGSGHGGRVDVTTQGSINTSGDSANGILAQSVGGHAGTGGNANGIVSFSANGGSGGHGGVVTVTNGAGISTSGDASNSIMAQSIGGGGGSGGGGFGLFYSEGGEGSAGGNGDSVVVTNSGSLTTTGVDSRGIFAQSVGGGGGNGGSSGGIAAFGGRGSITSDGGNVSVVNSGTIMTGLESPDPERPQATTGSQAIFAQSIGGGGGNGGSSAGWFTIGGSGGGGGDAGVTDVTNTGTLTTRDNNSSTIFAQSVGGGGGNGGGTNSASMAIASVAIGGNGAGGGDGDSVNVETSDGTLNTQGDNSHGILAQSVGGGGGNGGFAISTTGPSTPVRVSIGGTGGPGGDGGVVTVKSASDITTAGADAHGITVQSIGGGGGTGGFAVAATYAGTVSWNVAIGGSGGIGGDGKAVNVGTHDDPLTGAITTSGARSSGIVAQSIGGGGGNGGFTVTGALLSSATIGVSLGGSAGAGGRGDDVDVVSDATIVTSGDAGHGILAQSIGGGGGAGGWSLAAGVTAFGGAAVSLGGGGGAGSQAGVAHVENSGNIVTNADFSHGILAQSIGGGGGTGGMSGAAMVNFSGLIPAPPAIPVSVGANFAVAVGGQGGSGSFADTVMVSNSGDIFTNGDFSQGIVAQSIGGGGGAGGQSIAATANIDVPNPEADYTSVDVNIDFALALGGNGGTGHNGGAVEVIHDGRIQTLGDGSHGILAQSIGGGGGTGGNARAMTVGLDPSEWLGGAYVSPEVDITVNIGVGGTGGAGGDGDNVEVTNNDSIVTAGADAHGILAQSIGGGGGVGGGGYHGLDWEDYGVPSTITGDFDISEFTSLQAAEIVVGGKSNSAGSGSTVDILNSGTIITLGDGSFGILAQSIGGGGGIGGVGAVGEGTVGVGGGGGSSGDGGDVTVESNGLIETFGTSAHAMIAQSIGGGGGIAGNIDSGTKDFGVSLEIGQNGGSAGDGGMIMVDATGEIITHGSGSNGIFAQSVGGGGGLAGDLGEGFGFAGSAGGDGSGGEVQVHLQGSIATYGDVSHGIVAQSAGGQNDAVYVTEMNSMNADTTKLPPDRTHEMAALVSNTPKSFHGAEASLLLPDRADLGSDVAVEVDGNVLAYGADSHGIVAQSIGDDGNGNITIDISSGTVQGGTGSGVGVLILDGANNVLTNHGTIMTVGWIDGVAIRGTGGNETIDNFGHVTGSIYLGGGTNSVNNLAGATIESGSTIDLGADGVLTNDGVFSPGGSSGTVTTSFTGLYDQTSTGTFELTICGDQHDQVLLTQHSAATLDGTLKVVVGCVAYVDGTTYDIIKAADSQQITGLFSDLDLPETAFLDFNVEQFGGTVRVEVDVESFTSAASNPVERALAGCLDAFLPDATSDLSQVIGAFQLSTLEQVEDGFATLSPDTYDNLTRGTFQSMRLYQDRLAQRMDASRSNPFPGRETPMAMAFQGGSGWWLSSVYQGADQDASGGYLGQNFTISEQLGGYERSFGSSIVGGSIGITETDVDRDNSMANGSSDGIAGSVYGGFLWGQNYAYGVLSYAHENSVNRRDVLLGPLKRETMSKYDASALSALLTFGRRINTGRWGVEPFASVRYARLSQKGFTEAGAGSVNLIVEPRTTGWLGSDLGVRFTTSFGGEHSAFVPEFILAWNHDFGLDDRAIEAAFEGNPSASFTVDGQDVKRNGVTLGVGLGYHLASGWKVNLRYDRVQHSDFQANGLTFRVGSGF